MSICETVKTLKLYYMCNITERDREREAMSICEMVETLKWFYLQNTRERGGAMSIYEMVKTLKLSALDKRERETGYAHM